MDPFTPNLGADLVRIHRVITRGLDVAMDNTPRLLTDLEGPPHDGFVNYLIALTSVLDGHHAAEETIFFPFFRRRIPEAPFEHLALQHAEMLQNLRVIQAALPNLDAGKRVAGMTEQVADALRKLDATWQFHAETEESHLTPERVAATASLEDEIALRQQLAAHNQEHVVPAELCIPFLLYNLEVEDRAVMAAQMPPQITQELVPGPWKARWASMRPFLLE